MTEQVGSGLRALVIEDEEVVRAVVVEVLEGMGFVVAAAVSLGDARAKLTQAQTDLLVVDKNLPDGSGLLLARELSEKDVDAQVVVMSAYATLSSAVEALQAGVADYVLKPFDLADFRARLHRATEALKLRRANRRLLGELREKNALLEGLATRDPLTGLDNHASFQESVRREIARARRHGLSCALLLASIDRFRDINASLGFAGGDALLRALGAFLLRSGRASDVPAYLGSGVMARFAGDTFALLLPETDRTGGATRGEHLRRALSQAVVGPGLPPITASVGLAAFPEGMFSVAGTAGGADRGRLDRPRRRQAGRAKPHHLLVARAGQRRTAGRGPGPARSRSPRRARSLDKRSGIRPRVPADRRSRTTRGDRMGGAGAADGPGIRVDPRRALRRRAQRADR